MSNEKNDGRPVPSYSRDEALAVVSISGGKDSLATALVAIEQLGRERVRLVHADTGHEHELTERYVRETLPNALNLPIEIVRADFSERIAAKRIYVDTQWRVEGVPNEIIAAALGVLVPTGVPFLDLCLWKGRFPSSRARFCTGELKVGPLNTWATALIGTTNLHVESWQGVRRDESRERADALVWEPHDLGIWTHRPIAHWTAAQTFEIAARHGVPSNPLYRLGMGRVGCMPCVNCGKSELREIANRFPEVIARVTAWERAVSQASKLGAASFMFVGRRANQPTRTDAEHFEANRIESAIAWARTSRGGEQFDLEAFMPAPTCSSHYGLCE